LEVEIDMTDRSIRTDHQQLLLCPVCGFDATHVDFAYVAARREDRDVNEITVNAVTGQVRTHGESPAPAGSLEGEGRRHRIALAGHCEEGHNFALVFTQHKGGTYVEVVTPIPHDVDGDPS
jgi:hypothetical protein